MRSPATALPPFGKPRRRPSLTETCNLFRDFFAGFGELGMTTPEQMLERALTGDDSVDDDVADAILETLRDMTLLDRIAATLRRARIDGGWDDEAVAERVLREMREPTERMIDAAGAHDDHSTPYVQCEDGGVHRRAMIDAALNEAPARTSSEIGHG